MVKRLHSSQHNRMVIIREMELVVNMERSNSFKRGSGHFSNLCIKKRKRKHGTSFLKRPDKIKKLISWCWQQNIWLRGVCVCVCVCVVGRCNGIPAQTQKLIRLSEGTIYLNLGWPKSSTSAIQFFPLKRNFRLHPPMYRLPLNHNWWL